MNAHSFFRFVEGGGGGRRFPCVWKQRGARTAQHSSANSHVALTWGFASSFLLSAFADGQRHFQGGAVWLQESTGEPLQFNPHLRWLCFNNPHLCAHTQTRTHAHTHTRANTHTTTNSLSCVHDVGVSANGLGAVLAADEHFPRVLQHHNASLPDAAHAVACA